MKSARRSSMPWVWSACSWVKSTASSQSTSASRSCSRRSGEVSTRTRVTPAPLRRSTSSDVRRRRFLGLLGSHAPQPSAGRGTAPEEPEPGVVKLAVMPPPASSRRLSEPGCGRRLPPPLGEKAEGVLARLAGRSLRGYPARFAQDVGGLDHIGRLIALAAITTRGEIRRVGLKENAVCRQALRDGAKLVGLLERHDTGERDKETERYRPLREIAAARETMQHGGEGALPRFLLQDARHVLIRFARVDDERQTRCARGGDVIAQALFLRRTRA